MNRIRLKVAEWVFNKLLKPYEQVVVAQKVLTSKATIPEVEKAMNKMFGPDQLRRTGAQWRNLVDHYGMERVCMIEKMTEEQVRMKMAKRDERKEMKLQVVK